MQVIGDESIRRGEQFAAEARTRFDLETCSGESCERCVNFGKRQSALCSKIARRQMDFGVSKRADQEGIGCEAGHAGAFGESQVAMQRSIAPPQNTTATVGSEVPSVAVASRGK